MNENEILEKFSPPKEEIKEVPAFDKPPEGVPTEEVDLKTKLDIFNTLEIPMTLLSDDETNSRIRDIYDWGKLSGVTQDQMIITLAEISGKIGRMADKSLFNNVWEWVRLDSERRKIDAKMRSMEIK